MRLAELLTPRGIKLHLSATTKEGAIGEMVGLLVENGQLDRRDEALRAVLEREKTRTTGIGRGLAIPHGKTDATREILVAVGRADEPIDFRSVDGQGVSLIVLLISPRDKTGPHIQTLARISRVFSSDAFRRNLNQAPDGQTFYELICRQELATES